VNLNLAFEPCGPFVTNAFLLWTDQAAVIIDPAVGAKKLLEKARELHQSGIKVVAIWNTHGHFDHVCDNALWKNEFDAPIYAHKDDEFFLEHLREQAIWFGVPAPEVAKIDHYLEDGQTVLSGDISARVIHLPGHSPGSVAFDFGDFLISGDVLFQNSVGRTDLPGGSNTILAKSIEKLFTLQDETIIWAGHGERTTIGEEKQNNDLARQLLSLL
jgi:hydroxyacylglutathione hydrolase